MKGVDDLYEPRPERGQIQTKKPSEMYEKDFPRDFDPNNKNQLRQNSPDVPWYDHFANHPSKGLAPERLSNILQMAETGFIREQYELYDDMLEKDGIIASNLQTRKLSVLKLDYEILPINDNKIIGKKRAFNKQKKAMEDIIENLSADEAEQGYDTRWLDFEGLRSTLLDCVPRGFACPQLNWDSEGDEYRIVSAKHISQKHFVFGDLRHSNTDQPWNPFQVRVRTVNEPAYGIALPPYRYAFSIYSAANGYPSRAGLMRILAWYYLFKNYAFKSFVRYVEKYGMPWILGEYDPDSPKAQDNGKLFKAALAELQGNFIAAIPKDEMTITTEKFDSSGHEPFNELIQACDMQIVTCILGQTGTTMATPGKLGDEKEKGEVRKDLEAADAKAMETVINRRFVAPYAKVNFDECLIRYKVHYEEPEDEAKKADKWTKVATMIPVTYSQIREEFNVTEPDKDGEPCTTLHLQAAQPAQQAGANPFSGSRFIGSTTSLRSARLQRVQIIAGKLDGLVSDAVSAAIPLYATWLDGITDFTNLDAVKSRLQSKRKKFVVALQNIMTPTLEGAHAAGIEQLGLTPKRKQLSRQLYLFSGVPKWNIKSDDAQKFLDWHAFTATVIEGEKMSESTFEYIAAHVENSINENGITPDEFRREVIDSVGISEANPWHLNLIFRNNVSTAHAASTLFAMEQNKEDFPCWEFVAVIDGVTTEECEELNGMFFANDDTALSPQLHNNCRSLLSPVSQMEQNDKNYLVQNSKDVDYTPAPGFANDAVQSYTQWVADTMKDYPDAKSQINDFEE